MTDHGKILVADDDPMVLAMLSAVLQGSGYEVVTSNGGKAAVATAANASPDLIILDINMPDMDGLEACRHIKALTGCHRIPVIFLSASTEAEERIQCFKLGAVDLLTKPAPKEELLARVRIHLSHSRTQGELEEQAENLRQFNQLLETEIATREILAVSLSESEEKFRTLAGSAQDAFVMLDAESRVIFWNRAATVTFGYTEDEIMGTRFFERLVPQRFRAGYTEKYVQYLSTEAGPSTGKSVEMTALRRDGSEMPIEMSIGAVKLRDNWVGILVARDITERLHVQQTLKHSEERLNMALDAARMGSFEREPSGDIWRSRRHDEIFGHDTPLAKWTDAEFLGHIIPEDRGRVGAELALTQKGGQFQTEFRIIRANDRTQRWISVLGKTEIRPDGTPGCSSGVVIDITERKLAELEQQETQVQISLSQKLESVGRLASGVAHEINTPMQFITDNTQFLRQAMTSLVGSLTAYRNASQAIATGQPSGEALAVAGAVDAANDLDYLLAEIPKTFDETMGGLQRVTHIIKSLKEFSHPTTTSKHLADLNKAISTTITVTRHEWKYVAEMITDLDPDLPPIPLCIDEMNQVFLNLIVNAAHAISDALKQRNKEKGIITLRTRLQGNAVLVEVADNGTGIPEPAQAHIFEPFFTTKGVGKGTGQGLTLVRAIIVKNHGGTIRFTTQPGKGTTFHISLPLESPDVQPRPERGGALLAD
jgi:PAS domain S-box-containing protein